MNSVLDMEIAGLKARIEQGEDFKYMAIADGDHAREVHITAQIEKLKLDLSKANDAKLRAEIL